MAVKKTKTTQPVVREEAEVFNPEISNYIPVEKQNVFRLNVPMQQYGGIFAVVLLVISLIQSGFLGYLWTKLRVIELNANVQGAPSAQVPSNNQPAAQQVVTADNVPKITNEDKVRGNKSARIALVEYSDTECPFCKTYHPTLKKVLETYKNDVQWVYRHYPLSFHQNAQKQAEAAECVYQLSNVDTFWKFLDAIYDRTASGGTGFDNAKLGALAQEFGVNTQSFQQCLDSGKNSQKVADQMSGGTLAGVNGTPGTIVLDTKTGKTRLVSGAVSFEELKRTIDELLKG